MVAFCGSLLNSLFSLQCVDWVFCKILCDMSSPGEIICYSFFIKLISHALCLLSQILHLSFVKFNIILLVSSPTFPPASPLFWSIVNFLLYLGETYSIWNWFSNRFRRFSPQFRGNWLAWLDWSCGSLEKLLFTDANIGTYRSQWPDIISGSYNIFQCNRWLLFP